MLGGRLRAECGIAGARRIEECSGRRRFGYTTTRLAERQRMIEAEASRIATPNAATPRAGTLIPEAQKSFEPETANQKPFSWGSKGAVLFCERERPLCPRRPQAAYPLALVRRKGAFSHVRE